jgi:hypothetical protein
MLRNEESVESSCHLFTLTTAEAFAVRRSKRGAINLTRFLKGGVKTKEDRGTANMCF